MTKRYDIVGIGSALVDILMPCSEADLATHGFEKGRMHLIDAARAADLQAKAAAMQPGVRLVSGGSAANTCLGVAAFGGSERPVKAAFLGGIGPDALGRIFADDLARAQVAFSNIAAATAPMTGFCLCFITPDGERTMATYLGASADFDPAADAACAAAARLVYIEGYIWDKDARVALADRAIRAAKAAGGMVALSLSDVWCAEAYGAQFLHYCRSGLIDILFANEAEIMALTQASTFEAAAAAVRQLVPLGVFTRGAAGAVIVTGERIIDIPAAPATRVADTTGAGDSFAAGFLYGQLQGYDHAAAGALGARAAAAVISHVGARPQIDFAGLKEAL